MRGVFLLFIITVSGMFLSGYSQISKPQPRVQAILPDSADLSYYSKKNGAISTGQILGINASLALYNRYLKKADYGYISLNTVKENLKKGFVWDNDPIFTNMFGHPYHGSLYYNAARSNGYNYWQSGAFALGGSAMWELFMESEYPSANDIIATPVGGIAIGEVLYSTSDLILDDRTRGTERFGRELAALLVSPMRGLTRILTGDAWKHRHTSGRQYGIPLVTVDISTGLRSLSLRDGLRDKDLVWTTNVNVEYGDRFDAEDKIPYDYFSVWASLNTRSSQPLLGKLNITARLHGLELTDTDKDYLNLGLYQYFTYYNSDSISGAFRRIPFRYSSPASFGGGLMYRNKRWAQWSFDCYAHAMGILLGISLSDHYKAGERNYNMGSGFGIRAGFNLRYKDIAGLSASYDNYYLFTWEGYPDGLDWSTVDPKSFNVQGDKSQSTLGALSIAADVKLSQKISLSAIGHLYHRKTSYAQYSTVNTDAQEGSLMLKYRF